MKCDVGNRRSGIRVGVLCLLFGGALQTEEPRPPTGVEVLDVKFFENLGKSLSNDGAWLPVYVELRTTSKQTETVLLEGSLGSRETQPFVAREWVDVSPGAPRRAWLYLRAVPEVIQAVATVEIRARSGGVIRTGDRWTVSSYGERSSWISVLVVGENLADVTPWPRGTVSRLGGNEVEIQEIAEDCPGRKLPDNPLGYQGFDLVVLRETGAERLEPAQIAALRTWVYLGGFLIVAPSSRSGDVFRSEIVRELAGDALVEPVASELRPGNLFTLVPGPDGKQRKPELFARKEEMAPERMQALTLFDPLGVRGGREILCSERTEITGTDDGRRLYGELDYGRGRLGFLAFNDQSFRQENLEFLRRFWGKVVDVCFAGEKGTFARRAAQDVSSDMGNYLGDKSRDVGMSFLAALIAVYLVLVGPGLYFVLKRRGRLPSVIWAEPLLVIVYLGIIFAVGYVTKGVLTKTRVWTFISQVQGEHLALRESYLTVFSAAEDVYRIDCPRGFYLQPIFKNAEERRPVRVVEEDRGDAPAPNEPRTRAGVSLVDHRLAHWEEGHFVNLEVWDLGGEGVTVERGDVVDGSDEGQAPQLIVTNNLPYVLLSGLLYMGARPHEVPRLGPGESAVVGPPVPDKDNASAETAPWRRLLGDVSTRPGLARARDRFAPKGQIIFAGAILRADEDFRVDRRTTTKERVDLYCLYGSLREE